MIKGLKAHLDGKDKKMAGQTLSDKEKFAEGVENMGHHCVMMLIKSFLTTGILAAIGFYTGGFDWYMKTYYPSELN